MRLGMVKKRIEEAFEKLTEVTMKHDEIFHRFEEKLNELEV
jgi:hypothetical protein